MKGKFEGSDFKYMTFAGNQDKGEEKPTLHKIQSEFTSLKGRFIGYNLKCGLAYFNGYGRFSLSAAKNQPACISVSANDVANKNLCPICFPKGVEQD